MKRAWNWKDLTGKTSGSLLILKDICPDRGSSFAQCKCVCGNVVSKKRKGLLAGEIKSCGCLSPPSHGMSESVEYRAWKAMKSRCYYVKNDTYKWYGGKGIRVCDRWLNSFENFFKDMGFRPGKQHSIDRINSNKDYEPMNCRWATKVEQANNISTNHRLNFYGTDLTISEWGRVLNISWSTLLSRIRRGWTTQKALTTPIRKNGPNAAIAEY